MISFCRYSDIHSVVRTQASSSHRGAARLRPGGCRPHSIGSKAFPTRSSGSACTHQASRHGAD
eukprot:5560606-Prymnesium_polylepis.1